MQCLCFHPGKSCGYPGQNNDTGMVGTAFLYQDEVTYSCNLGHYTIGGNDTIVCLADAIWNGTALVCTSRFKPHVSG